jgi:F420-dependent oxidoreductase-like protein
MLVAAGDAARGGSVEEAMQFGLNVHYPQRRRTTPPDEEHNVFDLCVAAAVAAEESGFESIWYSDHFMFGDPSDDTEVELLECFTALAALAARTERVMLGPYVLGAAYRNAALTAKAFASLDVISHGRSIIALGAAWHKPEFEAYGWPFPPVADRMAILEDTIQIVERMMGGDAASYSGTQRSIAGAMNYPRPMQRPRPPLMIGGAGERRTLRLVAQYADMANIWGGTPDYVRHKFEVLRRHCDEVGRPYEEIIRSNHVSIGVARSKAEVEGLRERATDPPASPPLIGTPEDVREGLRAFAKAGSQYVVVDLIGWETLEPIHLFAEEVAAPLRAEL